MAWFVKAFIKASLGWLALAVSLGLAMALNPVWVAYRPAHLHMALLGFVAMMIFGVAYHVIPRFTGNPLHSPLLAGTQWWISNIGLAIMTAGFLARPHWPGGAPLLAIGGMLAAGGAYVFVFNLWRTVDGPAGLRPGRARADAAARSSAGRRLPVNGGTP